MYKIEVIIEMLENSIITLLSLPIITFIYLIMKLLPS